MSTNISQRLRALICHVCGNEKSAKLILVDQNEKNSEAKGSWQCRTFFQLHGQYKMSWTGEWTQRQFLFLQANVDNRADLRQKSVVHFVFRAGETELVQWRKAIFFSYSASTLLWTRELIKSITSRVHTLGNAISKIYSLNVN